MSAHAPRVIAVKFERLNHPGAAMAVAVIGEHLTIGGAPLFARVGSQPVSHIIPINGGRGFTGTLATVPHEGDRLHIHYIGRLEMSTDVTYHGGGGPNA